MNEQRLSNPAAIFRARTLAHNGFSSTTINVRTTAAELGHAIVSNYNFLKSSQKKKKVLNICHVKSTLEFFALPSLGHVKTQRRSQPPDLSQAGSPQGPSKQTGGTDGCLQSHLPYPAVVVYKTQPLHGHIAHVTPTKEDFSWRGEKTELLIKMKR